MIVTVTLNPALDVTYRLDALTLDATNRVAEVSCRAGGKGVNVARLLHGLSGGPATAGGLPGGPEGGGGAFPEEFGGVEVMAVGLAGGTAGTAFLADLDEAGLAYAFVPCAAETRRTVAVVDSGAATVTMLNEPGPVVTPAEWQALCHRLEGLLPEATVVVLSGSLPPGLPPDAYATLVRQAERHGVPAVLDADGGALLAALSAGPEIVKPNISELARALTARNGAPGSGEPAGPPDAAGGAAWMRQEGARAVVVSDGPRGLYADTPDGRWRAVPPEVRGGNPTGAGDAAVAALALGLALGWDWPRTLVRAAALSAAAVRHPLAGQIDPAVYLDHVGRVRLELARSESEDSQCR